MPTLEKTFLKKLAEYVGADNVLTDPSERIAYGYDNSRYEGLPDVVCFAIETQQIAQIVRLCYDYEIPVYTRGRGTATTGACVPIKGGLVLALERMQKILHIDSANRVMVVEAGVLNQSIQNAAASHGFFWAPDPSSANMCTLGGNLGCNAAGPRAVKYGSCRENTLGLTAITGTGEIIKTGVYTTKGVVGYDLTRLLIGSEGSLGIITQANLKLLPLPEKVMTFRALYSDLKQCTEAIAQIMAQPVVPCALEFIDERCLNIIRTHGGIEIPIDAKALLMIEIDGPALGLESAATHVIAAAKNQGLIEITTAATEHEAALLWKMRKALSPALKKVAPKKINEDVVVPVSHLTEFILFTHQLDSEYQIDIVNFGHAGNGNIHVNLLYDPRNTQKDKDARICLEKIFAKVLELHGTLSGEHGVGLDKREFVKYELDPVSIKIMHHIKKVFDPKGILNPGKILPDIE